MDNFINVLSAKFINEVNFVHDYINIIFSDGATLNIYNKYDFISPNEEMLTELKGKKIISWTEEEAFIEIIFSDQSRLIISLENDAYQGPEALELSIPGKPIIIW